MPARNAAYLVLLGLCACVARPHAPQEGPPPGLRLVATRTLGAVSDTEPVDLDNLAPPPEEDAPPPGIWHQDGQLQMRLTLPDGNERRLVLYDLRHYDGAGACYSVHGVADGGAMPRLGVVRVSTDGRWLAAPFEESNEWTVVLAELDGTGRGYLCRARTAARWAYVDWPTLDPRTRRVAFWAFGGGTDGSLVVVTEPKGAELVVVDRQGAGMVKHWPTYASNGRLAFRSLVDEKGGAGRVTVDGTAQRIYASVGIQRFDAAGEHIAYDARRDGKGFVVVDGLEWGPCDEVGSPRFLAGHAVGFVVRDGRAASWVEIACPPASARGH